MLAEHFYSHSITPTVFFFESTTTRTAMNTASNNTQSISIRSIDQHGFGVYQLTVFGTSDATIRTLVPISISAPSYRKVLIVELFFHQILGHAESPFLSFSDLVTTVATCFDMSTAIAERGAETAANSIRDSIFRISTMIGVSFFTSKRKYDNITNPAHRQDGITYFTFRANINPHLVDTRAPDYVHSFEISLRLPNTITSSSASFPPNNSVQPNTTSTPVDIFDSTLSKLSDNDLHLMSAARMRELLSTKKILLLRLVIHTYYKHCNLLLLLLRQQQ